MCGIAGIVGPIAHAALAEPMVAALSRRGPDDHGIWADPAGGVALGHTRLSIIDLSSAGHQPMTHGDGRYWITFNGEIYNYQDIRSELEGSGAVFSSHTDTEVIIAAFARWGVDSLTRLRGMFAFALWDRLERRAYLARDRIGIKPLLWSAAKGGGVVFASEIKAILASGLVDSIIEPRAIFDLLATGSVCQPGTVLRGVQAVAPGTCMMLEEGRPPRHVCYWNLVEMAAKRRHELSQLPYDQLVQRTREQLDEACRYHLIADVPVGSFLSGGIDSTAITALMSRHMSARVKSFSVGFERTKELEHELDAARIAAEYIGCEHMEVVLRGTDVADAFDDLVNTIDQPSYDGANTYFVSRAARQAVKVTLSGLGGDEIFAGYPHFSWLQLASRSPAGLLDRMLAVVHWLRPNDFTRVSALRCQDPDERYAWLRRTMSDAAIRRSLADALRGCFRDGELERHVGPLIEQAVDSLAQTSMVECRHYLVDTLLRDADAMSMGHGLEVRPVLLDHVLVEHALALPPEAKIRDGHHKAVLIDAVADLLPPALLTRPKTGFTLPLGTWLRTTLRDRVEALPESGWLKGVFRPEFVRHCINAIDSPRSARILWTLLVLNGWATRYHCGVAG